MTRPRSEDASALSGGTAGILPPCEENSSTSSVFHTIEVWLDRRHTRQALRDLAERNDHLLADIGLTRKQALREAAKPFWLR